MGSRIWVILETYRLEMTGSSNSRCGLVPEETVKKGNRMRTCQFGSASESYMGRLWHACVVLIKGGMVVVYARSADGSRGRSRR